MRKIIVLGVVTLFLFSGEVKIYTQHFSPKVLSSLYSSYLKGLYYLEKDQPQRALKELEKAKSTFPRSVIIRLKIAYILIKLGKYQQVEEELKEVKGLNPQNLEASLALIFLYSYLGKKDLLDKEYGVFLENVHKLHPQDLRISEYLGQYYFYKKRIDDTIRIYEAIVKAHPEYIEAKYLLGYFYEERGKRKKAIQIWREILKREPNHADTLNSLGYIYAEEEKNLDEAKKLILKALEQDPDNGAYLDSLGWVYFKKGDYKKAELYLKKAIEKIKDPVIYEHLGDLYIEIGEKDTGVKWYRRGLKEFPDCPQLKKKVKEYGGKNSFSGETSK